MLAFDRLVGARRPLVATIVYASATILFAGRAIGASPPDIDWALKGGNAYEQHFSTLRQINTKNVSRLNLEWYADMPTADGLTGVPLVVDGVVYQSGALGKAWANDAHTGKQLWEFDAEIHFPLGLIPSWGSRLSRGLAIWKDRVLKATGDCRLFALDRRSGAKIWEVQACDPAGGRTITGAPRVGDGKVFIGNADGDTAAGRGHVDAFDIESGKHLWRFYTIPGEPAHGFESAAMERASRSWSNEYWKHSRGGSPWEGITYDPRTDLVYIGTDGPSPFDPTQRGNPTGDELFTNAIVAVRADTGEYVWHYSTTPQDGWNYASTLPVVLADLTIGGRKREVVLNAPKNGFFYVIDARAGKLLNEPKPIVDVNWASRIDMITGRPVRRPEAQYWLKGPDGAVVSPSPFGARNWMPMSFSPLSGLVYIPVMDFPARMSRNPDQAIGATEIDFYYSRDHGGNYKGTLLAWDPVAQKARWRRDIGLPYQGGVLSTAGNLVFQGTTHGDFVAYRDNTGEKLWSSAVGSGVLAAPSTVLVDGKQMVLVAVGTGSTSAVSVAPRIAGPVTGPSRLLAFSLTGSASLAPATASRVSVQQPLFDDPDDSLVVQGKRVWDSNGCEICHGAGADGGLGSVPDARLGAALPVDSFAQIVRGGASQDRGMPVFADSIADNDLPALQAYLRRQAWIQFQDQKRLP